MVHGNDNPPRDTKGVGVRLESLSGHVRKHDGLVPRERELTLRGLHRIVATTVPCRAPYLAVNFLEVFVWPGGGVTLECLLRTTPQVEGVRTCRRYVMVSHSRLFGFQPFRPQHKASFGNYAIIDG